MKLSKLRPTWTQPLLFDLPLGNHGHCRTVIGELAEELTAAMVDGRRHRTENGVYCPDVSNADGFFESKAMGLSRQTFIYSGRLTKDRDFANNHRLAYVIWHHKAATKEADTVITLRHLVIARLQYVFLVPFADIDRICSGLKEEPLNSRYGPAHKYGTHACTQTYGSGYRIGYKDLMPFIYGRIENGTPGGQQTVCSTTNAPDMSHGVQVLQVPGAPTVVVRVSSPQAG